MKHNIKHTLAVLVATIGIVGSFVAVPLPAAASRPPDSSSTTSTTTTTLTASTATPTPQVGCLGGQSATSDGKNCDIVCPGQIAIKSYGQNVTRSCCPDPNGKIIKMAEQDRPRACLFSKYLNPVINLLSAVVGLVVVIGIIFGAIQVSSSAGDPQKAASGKGHIRNALLGLLAYILLYSFLQFIIPGGKFN